MRNGVVVAGLALVALTGCTSAEPRPPTSATPVVNDPVAATQLDAALDLLEEQNTGRVLERLIVRFGSFGTYVAISEGRYDVADLRMDFETRSEATTPALEQLILEGSGETDIDKVRVRLFKDGDSYFVTGPEQASHGRWLRLDSAAYAANFGAIGFGSDPTVGLPHALAVLRERTVTSRAESANGQRTYQVRLPADVALPLMGTYLLDRLAALGSGRQVTGQVPGTVLVDPNGVVELVRFDLQPLLDQLRLRVQNDKLTDELNEMYVNADVHVSRVGDPMTLSPPPADAIDPLEGEA